MNPVGVFVEWAAGLGVMANWLPILSAAEVEGGFLEGKKVEPYISTLPTVHQ